MRWSGPRRILPSHNGGRIGTVICAMNVLRRTALVSTLALLAWAPTTTAYNFYPEGGFLGYTYNKWGAPALGTGATVYWSIMPAGTPGSAYCAPGCTP